MTNSMDIRPLSLMSEMHQVEALQQVYWGRNNDDLVPAHMLFSLASFGGHVIAAYDDKEMVGAVVGFLGTDMNSIDARPAMTNLLIVSKRMIVLPEYRSHGVGYRLKQAQRNFAIRQGIRLVTWTFDPLLASNAYLNIGKLGGVSQRYVNDYFGNDTDNSKLKSDRLVVDWWVTQRRVEERINGNRSTLTLEQYLSANTRIVNEVKRTDDNVLVPSDMIVEPTQSLALVEIPPQFVTTEGQNEELASLWREHIRKIFNHLMGMGFMVTDFLRANHQGHNRAFYLLSFDGRPDTSLN